MGKLENIPKEQVFSVPEGYFDKLPSQVQSRIVSGQPETRMRPVYRYALQYALPLLIVAAVLFFYYRPAQEPASILATVETEDLINYLHESGLTTEDLLENVDFNREELEAIENEVYDLELRNFNDEEIELELNAL